MQIQNNKNSVFEDIFFVGHNAAKNALNFNVLGFSSVRVNKKSANYAHEFVDARIRGEKFYGSNGVSIRPEDIFTADLIPKNLKEIALAHFQATPQYPIQSKLTGGTDASHLVNLLNSYVDNHNGFDLNVHYAYRFGKHQFSATLNKGKNFSEVKDQYGTNEIDVENQDHALNVVLHNLATQMILDPVVNSSVHKGSPLRVSTKTRLVGRTSLKNLNKKPISTDK